MGPRAVLDAMVKRKLQAPATSVLAVRIILTREFDHKYMGVYSIVTDFILESTCLKQKPPWLRFLRIPLVQAGFTVLHNCAHRILDELILVCILTVSCRHFFFQNFSILRIVCARRLGFEEACASETKFCVFQTSKFFTVASTAVLPDDSCRSLNPCATEFGGS
jgi:hypothetical protein